MPISLQCTESFPLSQDDVAGLWQKVVARRGGLDDQVNISCVDEQEIQRLNEQYRGVSGSTNVLTFSYPGDRGEHDIALCISVAKQESAARNIPMRDYLALLLVHAFLHATGLDHEASEQAARQMREAETNVLRDAGFKSISLGGPL